MIVTEGQCRNQCPTVRDLRLFASNTRLYKTYGRVVTVTISPGPQTVGNGGGGGGGIVDRIR